MARYRVGSEGVRIINPDGGGYFLPPGAVLDKLPARYEGKLLVETLDEIEPKRLGGYLNKVIRPAEDK